MSLLFKRNQNLKIKDIVPHSHLQMISKILVFWKSQREHHVI